MTTPENVLLKSLSVDGLTLTPAFDPAISDYTVSSSFGWTATLNAEAQIAGVTVTGTGEQNLTGHVSDLVVSGTGTKGDKSAYHVKVTLADVPEGDDLSTYLKTLVVTGGTLVPEFNPTVKEYQLIMPGTTYAAVDVASTAAWTSSQATNLANTYLSSGDTLAVTCTSSSGAKRVYSLKRTTGITLDYNANGGDLGSAPTTQAGQTGTSLTVATLPSGFGRTGYNFASWNTQADGNGTNFAPGSTYSLGASSATLYARWTLGQYSVTYDGNGNSSGSVPTDGTLHVFGSTVYFSANVGSLSKTGSLFAGWNTKADGSGTGYAAGNTTMVAGDLILYARWSHEVKSISAGADHVLVVATDGSLFASGRNDHGELGDGGTTDSLVPKKVMDSVASAVAGGGFSLILKSDGTVWSCGLNSHGQLGDGTTSDRFVPVQVLSSVSAVAAGYSHSMFLKNDGTLWACGQDTYGQLADGSTSDRLTPVQVMSSVSAVSAGYSHTLILKLNGTLWSVGGNGGQLGDGSTTNRSAPVQVLASVSTLSAGWFHSLAVKTDGTLWVTGINTTGELGIGTTTTILTFGQTSDSSVSAVAGGRSHSVFLKADGTLWAAGSNTKGQLANGTTAGNWSRIQVAASVTSVACGQYDTLYVKSDKSVWAAGANTYGQLGDGSTTDRSDPVQILF